MPVTVSGRTFHNEVLSYRLGSPVRLGNTMEEKRRGNEVAAGGDESGGVSIAQLLIVGACLAFFFIGGTVLLDSIVTAQFLSPRELDRGMMSRFELFIWYYPQWLVLLAGWAVHLVYFVVAIARHMAWSRARAAVESSIEQGDGEGARDAMSRGPVELRMAIAGETTSPKTILWRRLLLAVFFALIAFPLAHDAVSTVFRVPQLTLAPHGNALIATLLLLLSTAVSLSLLLSLPDGRRRVSEFLARAIGHPDALFYPPRFDTWRYLVLFGAYALLVIAPPLIGALLKGFDVVQANAALRDALPEQRQVYLDRGVELASSSLYIGLAVSAVFAVLLLVLGYVLLRRRGAPRVG